MINYLRMANSIEEKERVLAMQREVAAAAAMVEEKEGSRSRSPTTSQKGKNDAPPAETIVKTYELKRSGRSEEVEGVGGGSGIGDRRDEMREVANSVLTMSIIPDQKVPRHKKKRLSNRE